MRHHGGAKKEEYNTPSIEKVEKGFENLAKHIENMKQFGINPIVAINSFATDTVEEVNLIKEKCKSLNVQAIKSEGWEKGGEGTEELAKALVVEIEKGENNFKQLYDWNSPVKEKIKTIAQKIYGASEVLYSKKAEKDLKTIAQLELDRLPICMAKTQKSFSDDASLLGRPTGFSVTVREFEYAVGAGFIIPILGNMMRMPGLPSTPASEGMNIDNEGVISGLS